MNKKHLPKSHKSSKYVELGILIHTFLFPDFHTYLSVLIKIIAIINSNEYLLSVPKYFTSIILSNLHSINRKTKADKMFLKKRPTLQSSH